MPSRRSHSTGPGSMSSRSASNPSVNDGGVVLDRKTRQPLFFDCRVCILGRSKLSKDEAYSESKAEVLMNRMYKKRQSHCLLFCLEDSLRFEKSSRLGAQPMRNFVKYNAIKHMFIFQEKPNVFMLCIDSGRSDRRTYEAFKCKVKEDVFTICDLVFKASKDPEFKLRDMAPLREYVRFPELTGSVNQLSTNDLHDQPTSLRSTNTVADVRSPNLGIQNVFDMYERQGRQSNVPANHNSDVTAIENPITETSRTLVYEHPQGNSPDQIQLLEMNEGPDYLDEVLAFDEKFTNAHDDEWEVSITYLQWDNQRGAIINDRGPVYLYVARHLHPVNNAPPITNLNENSQ